MSKIKVNTITNISGGAPDIPGIGTGGGGSGSGADAWGSISSDGSLLGGLNVSSSFVSQGTYSVIFTTPMPDANYSVTTGGLGGNNQITGKTASGFTLTTSDNNGAAQNFGGNFAVFATNALPPTGGTGTDAWATVQSAGTIDASFNVASVTKTGTGIYAVVFTTPMPTSNYSVVASSLYPYTGTIVSVAFQTTTGFTVDTYGVVEVSPIDANFAFTVNATNAVLPDSFSEEQIQSVVDLAQSGVTNPGASAWGDIAADGTIENGLNIASVNRTSTGEFEINFITPMPDANYSAQATALASNSRNALIRSKSATQLVVNIRSTTDGVTRNDPFSFAVFATNALPPKGGTGTDCWGSVNTTGALESGFNCTTSSLGTGQYYVAFNTPMPSVNYSVVATASYLPNNVLCTCQVNSKTVNGFSVLINNSDTGVSQNNNFNFAVNATNATLPQTVTQEQIDAAINNPGASAWGDIAEDGTLEGGLNIASATNTSPGTYSVVFTTPMPSSNYAVNVSVTEASSRYIRITSSPATGFTVSLLNGDNNPTNASFSFAVFATNALPPKGGTGTDAWANCSPSAVISGFNIDTFTKNNIGSYTLTFVTPMPTDEYSVVAASSSSSGRVINVINKTTTGFDVVSRGITSDALTDGNFNVAVNATNATLPTTFTEAQIQSVIDANPQGIAKAWITYNGISNTILESFNISSVQDNGTGNYTIFFTNSFSNSNYCCQASSIRQNTLSDSNYAEVCSILDPQLNRCSIVSTVASSSSGIPAIDTIFYFTAYSD